MIDTITVYTKPNCQPCIATKRTLDRMGLDYIQIDITETDGAVAEIEDLGYKEVPVVIAGVEHWSGFRPDRFQELL